MRERKTKTRKETHPALAAVVIAVVGLAAALASGAAVILQGLGESVIVVSREEEVMRKKCKEVSKEEEETDEQAIKEEEGPRRVEGGGASVSDSLALAQLIFPRVLPRALFSRMNRQPPPTCGANTSKEACRRNHHGKRRRLEGSAGAAMRGLEGRVFFPLLALSPLPPPALDAWAKERKSI